MAQYTMTYQCAHSERVQLYGPEKDRSYRLAQAKQRLCRDCARDSHAGDAAEAAMVSRIEGLPVLSGTERQRAWAETIRREKLAEAEAQVATRRADPRAQEEPALMAVWETALKALRGKSDARWWIDNRIAGAVYLLQQATR